MGYFETPTVDWISLERLQQLRLFSILALIPMMVVPIILNDLTYLYRYLTQWSIEIATIATILIYFSAKKPDNVKLNKIALITFEIAIYLTVATMVSFWVSFPNIYFCCIETYWKVALTISHIIPQVIILSNLFLSDVKIYLKHGIFGAMVGIAYLITDYLRHLFTTETIDTYPFLQWGTPEAIRISVFFIVFGYLFYIVIWKINESLKNEIDIR